MTQLNLSYSEIENMPLEFTEWFYKRRVQEIVDSQKQHETPVF